jgi:predicted amino acid dehydrogenase
MWKTGRSRPDAAAALATSRGVIEAAVAHLLAGQRGR